MVRSEVKVIVPVFAPTAVPDWISRMIEQELPEPVMPESTADRRSPARAGGGSVTGTAVPAEAGAGDRGTRWLNSGRSGNVLSL